MKKEQTNQLSMQRIENPRRNSRKIKLTITAVFLLIFVMPLSAMAEKQRFVLDFNDSHFRGRNGTPSRLFLKKELRRQYPGVDVFNLKLRKVVLVAKSKKGLGEAELRVGRSYSQPYSVAGRPRDFHQDHGATFDKIKIRTPSRDSRGPWQLMLYGNFKVRKVVLVVDNREEERYGYYYYPDYWRW